MLLHWALGADNDDSGEADNIAGQCSGHGGNDNGDVSFPKAPPPPFFFSLIAWAAHHFSLKKQWPDDFSWLHPLISRLRQIVSVSVDQKKKKHLQCYIIMWCLT